MKEERRNAGRRDEGRERRYKSVFQASSMQRSFNLFYSEQVSKSVNE